MIKYAETIRRQQEDSVYSAVADELFKCVWPFRGVGA